jgi:hypothetical protein
MLPVTIMIAAVMVGAILLALNVRTTYSLSDRQVHIDYARLLEGGCESSVYVNGNQPVAVDCPLWVRP